MSRVTDKQITDRVARLQKEGMNVGLDGQYGRFRVTSKNGARDLSPRLPNREILDWLDAFESGWRHFQQQLGKYCVIALESSGDSRAFIQQLANEDYPWGDYGQMGEDDDDGT